MQDTVQAGNNAQISDFRHMKLLILVPHVGHSVVTSFTGPSEGGDFMFALREALSLYDQDLGAKLMEEGKALFAGEYDLVKAEVHATTTSGSRTVSIRDLFKH